MWLIVYSNDHAPLPVRPIYSSSKLRTAQMMIFSLVAMIGLEKCCITSACLQWLCHSGERIVARGPLVLNFFFFFCNSTSSLYPEHWIMQEPVYVLHLITYHGHIVPRLAELLLILWNDLGEHLCPMIFGCVLYDLLPQIFSPNFGRKIRVRLVLKSG